MEIILEIFAELFLQLILEVIVNFGFHSFSSLPKPGPVVAALGYLLLGAALGGLSLLVFQDSFIDDYNLKLLNLIVTPVILGITMSLVGRFREKRDKDVIRLEKFAYGFLFALGLAVVRFIGAG